MSIQTLDPNTNKKVKSFEEMKEKAVDDNRNGFYWPSWLDTSKSSFW